MRKEQVEAARGKARWFFDRAGIILTEMETASIEIADFGLDQLETTGLEIVTYVNTERCCAKELILFPLQTCPEHRHPNLPDGPGKEETFRCRWGMVYLYVPGNATASPHAIPPRNRGHAYTVWHEIVLRPGEQHTILPDTRHWFQSGPEGAVVSEFSTRSRDDIDVFTDPQIRRMPEVE
jgi:D-lyxose ketol-isomerase